MNKDQVDMLRKNDQETLDRVNAKRRIHLARMQALANNRSPIPLNASKEVHAENDKFWRDFDNLKKDYDADEKKIYDKLYNRAWNPPNSFC